MIPLVFGIRGMAWAMVGAAAFSCVFTSRLARRSLEMRGGICSRALAPVVMPNTPLAASLFVAERAVPLWIPERDLLHVAVTGVLGGVVYAAGRLLLPIPAPETERSRWLKIIGWSRSHASG